MRLNGTGRRLVIWGATMVLGCIGWSADADARPKGHPAQSGRTVVSHASGTARGVKHARIGGHGRKELARGFARSYAGFMSCVPFARENSGIELAGNAAAWWGAASGVYERGSRPEVGSVLNFRANGHMQLGHVAVVSRVVNARLVEVDHANWAGPGANRGGVSRNVSVVDVSTTNDWSAVRVGLGSSEEFGSIYPTYGFIYDRPDDGVMVANTNTAPMPVALNAPPRDLRSRFDLIGAADAAEEPVEVAEAVGRVSYRRHSVHRAHSARSSVNRNHRHASR